MEVLNTKIDTIKKPELKFPNDISAPHFQPRSLTREKEQDLDSKSEDKASAN